MKKVMFLFFLPAALFLGSCNGGTTVSDEEKEKESTEIQKVDSLTSEMDNVKGEIESKTQELDDALNSLEPEKK